jgi:hypothetical protein
VRNDCEGAAPLRLFGDAAHKLVTAGGRNSYSNAPAAPIQVPVILNDARSRRCPVNTALLHRSV